jgi:uncharacterized protein YjiK
MKACLITIRLVFIILTGLTACSQGTKTNLLYEQPGYRFPYQADQPNRAWKLPASLLEISGIGFIDDHRLACVQDEKGIIYVFNLGSGKIESNINFGEDGDFEAIEIVGNNAWVLKSNGTLYEIKDYLDKAGPVVKKHPTSLTGKNDTEGLAYSPEQNSLLIACKEQPFADESKGKDDKAIYSFNLETNQLDLNPFLLISTDTVEYYRNKSTMAILGDENFKPSGIAVHPVTGDIFILASAGKLLLVMTTKGRLLAMIKLGPDLFRQPEGICFSPDGNVYIASEGDGGAGCILEFTSVEH